MEENKLTKIQKVIVLLTILWELIAFAFCNQNNWGKREFDIPSFIILSLPFILYWGGVWIFGFGYIIRFLKKVDKIMFGEGFIPFFFSNKGTIHRLQYLGGFIFINIFSHFISMLWDNFLFFLIIQFLCLYCLFTLIQKRSRDFNKSALFFIIWIGAGLTFRDLNSVFGTYNFVVFDTLFVIFALLAAGANLCLLFTKGEKSQKIKEAKILNKRWVFPLFFTLIGIILAYLFGLIIGSLS